MNVLLIKYLKIQNEWFSESFDLEEAEDIYKRSVKSPFKNN